MRLWRRTRAIFACREARERGSARGNTAKFPAGAAPVSALLIVLCAPFGLSGQAVSTGDPTHVKLRAIGQKLQCQCEPCGKSVGDCDMGGCSYRDRINGEIRPMLQSGMGEAAILARLREIHGDNILASPPAEGFNLLGWVMPFLGLALGLFAIRMVVARWKKPRPAVAAVPSQLVDKYREEIEKELGDLE